MKRLFLFLASLLAGVFLFIWTLNFVGWQEIREAFRVFVSWNGVAVLILTFFITAIGVWRWQEVLGGLNVRISLKDLFGSYLAGYSIMFFAPIAIWGGEVLRGYYLKEKKFIAWEKGMASVIIDRILEWTINLIVIILGVSLFLSKIYTFPKKIEIIFGAVFLLFLFSIVYFYIKVFKKESFIKSIAEIFGVKKVGEKNVILAAEREIFIFFRIKNKLMWKALGISFLRAAAMWIRVWLVIFFLGKSVSGLSALSVLGFNYLAVMIPIPAALGSHEAIQTFVFGAFNFGLPAATAFAIIIRSAETIISLAGAIILFKLGTEIMKKMFFRKIDKIIGDKEENSNVN